VTGLFDDFIDPIELTNGFGQYPSYLAPPYRIQGNAGYSQSASAIQTLHSMRNSYDMLMFQNLVVAPPTIHNARHVSSHTRLNWQESHNIERTDQGTRIEKNGGNRRVRGD
jgi:hypothetical protein